MDPVEELERRGWEALSSSPAAARRFYDDVLDDEVVMLLPGGLVLADRTAVLESMSGQPWAAFRMDDAVVLRLSTDAAVVAYRATARRDQDEYRALCSSTYARRDGAWKLAFHQQTPV